jgi:glycosyltransferase involved in cell wall biosynthesis
MRIAFLCTSSLDYPSPRGRWMPLAQELARAGHRPHLLMLHHTYDRLPAEARARTYGDVVARYVGQMHVYGPVGRRRYFSPAELLRVSLLGALSLARAAVEARAEAVHVCKPQPINGLAGLLAARALRCPLFVDCDDYEAGGNRTASAWQRRTIAAWEDGLPPRATAVTVNTRFLAQRARILGVDEGRIAYVPNGVHTERLTPPPRRHVDGLRVALGLGDAPVALYLGTLSQTTHDVALLLDAFALAARRLPGARLLLVGEGEDRERLQQRAQELGLSDRALFAGPAPADATPAFLALAACSVDPVGDDPVARARSPLKIVESLASGVPVVTGDVGDRREVLGDAGLVVTPGSAAALASGLEAALTDSTLQGRMPEGARARAGLYCWDRLAPRWERVYHEATPGSAPGGGAG